MNGRTWIALASGVLFGVGLALSGMLNPAKVLAFLDVAGNWDPSLALVMAGALAVMVPAWQLQSRTAAALPKLQFSMADLDVKLVGGAALFGVGWGLVGYCPGPAVASLALLDARTLLFVAAMLAGMELHRRYTATARGRSPLPH